MAIKYSRYVIKDVFTNAEGVETDHYYSDKSNGYVADITKATHYETITDAHLASVAATEELVEVQFSLEIVDIKSDIVPASVAPVDASLA